MGTEKKKSRKGEEVGKKKGGKAGKKRGGRKREDNADRGEASCWGCSVAQKKGKGEIVGLFWMV